MQRVKVWNDNDYVHKEKFRDELLEIKPHTFIVMEKMDAIQFRGQYTPMVVDFDNQPVPQYFKKIRLEDVSENEPMKSQLDQHLCHSCGATHTNKDELEAHIDETHLDQLVDQEVAQKRRGRPRKETTEVA